MKTKKEVSVDLSDIVALFVWGLLIVQIFIMVNRYYAISDTVNGLIISGLITSVFQYLARLNAIGKRTYKNGLGKHDPDSGRDMHYECFCGVVKPNLFVNPIAIFLPIWCYVFRMERATGNMSITEKKASWFIGTMGVRWNIGDREIISKEAFAHVKEVYIDLKQKDSVPELKGFVDEEEWMKYYAVSLLLSAGLRGEG